MLIFALSGGVMSCVLIGCYRFLALKFRWLDHPNDRSSHRTITPRGAGIVLALLITAAAVFNLSGHAQISASFVAIFAIALIGWWDDLRGVAARYRFVFYWLSTALAAAIVYPALIDTALSQPAHALLTLLAISLPLLWLTNLYNFMDGINGIAGFEALFVFGAILWLGAGSDFNTQLAPLMWFTLFAITGFLLWNFPSASVFMGDAGSAYLGALLGLFIMWSTQMGGPSLYSWLILLGVFVIDTGYTLSVRTVTGQRWYLAHRVHAYQLLSGKLHSHTRTVLLLSAINVLWLLPCAWLARSGGWSGAAAMAVAYAPLLAGCHRLKAGVQERGTV